MAFYTPTETEMFTLLDDLAYLNHREPEEKLLVVNFGISKDLAAATAKEWQKRRIV